MSNTLHNHACIGFEMKNVIDAWRHMNGYTIIERYGDEGNGKYYFTGDEGERYLAKCANCGGYILVQKSEWHGPEDDYYIDFFPVPSPDAAHELNRKFDGYEIELQFPKRYMMSNNLRLCWSKKEDIDES